MLNLGDRVRLREHPGAPLLTIAVLYLQASPGQPETLWAGCRWTVPGRPTVKPQLVHFAVSELEAESANVAKAA
jgi:hypothetical protein